MVFSRRRLKIGLASYGYVIDDANLRSRLGGAGRQTVEQKYSMRHSASLMAKVIEALSACESVQDYFYESRCTKAKRHRTTLSAGRRVCGQRLPRP